MPRPHDPFLDLVPPQGVRFTPPPLCLFEDLRRLQQRLQLLHHSGLARAAQSRGLERCAGRGGTAGRRQHAGAAGHFARHDGYGLDIGYAASKYWQGEDHEARFLSVAKALGSLGALGAPAICLSLSACRSGRAADGQGAGPAVSRHSLPAREPESAEGDAPAGASGKDARAHRGGGRSVRSWPSARPLSSGSPGRPRRTFALLLDWLAEAKLSRVGCFKYDNVERGRGQRAARPCPEEIKAERYDRLMRHQQAISAELLATRIGKTIEVLVDEVDAKARSPARIGTRGNRRQRIYRGRDHAQTRRSVARDGRAGKRIRSLRAAPRGRSLPAGSGRLPRRTILVGLGYGQAPRGRESRSASC